ncbi:Uncharacterised protein [Mycobacteroides abscessus subsp. massiliense]|nr:Uncharacterised protein [Mycobacteroides abscessus subsp. massiliense]
MFQGRPILVRTGQPVVPKRHGRQVEARFRCVDHAGHSREGQVAAQHFVRTTAGQGFE